jgi:hypothetical protein
MYCSWLVHFDLMDTSERIYVYGVGDFKEEVSSFFKFYAK